MSLSLFKTLIWLVALGLTGYIGWFFYDVRASWAEETAPLSHEKQKQVLKVEELAEPTREDLVDYTAVDKGFIDLDWTGKPPPPPPVESVVDVGPTETPKTPVKDLLKVFYLHQDGWYPERSFALIEYTDTQLAKASRASAPGSNAPRPKDRLVPGDHLPAPHDGIEVLQILASGIVFDFSDGREPETVRALELELPSGIVLVPPGEVARTPSTGTIIPRADEPVPFVPRTTTPVGDNHWRLGTEDLDRFEENYTQIITEEATHRRWRNPKNGAYEGIELTHVEPGGTLAAHGAKSGDVIKSINGTPVSSVPEAITYVKNNAETTSVWEVLIVNKGIESKYIFESPEE